MITLADEVIVNAATIGGENLVVRDAVEVEEFL